MDCISNNIHTKTQNFDRSKIDSNFVSSLNCPLDDSDTTNKDGFTAGETINFFIKSVSSEIEIPIILSSDSTITAQDKKEIFITNVDIENKYYQKYNPLAVKMEEIL